MQIDLKTSQLFRQDSSNGLFSLRAKKNHTAGTTNGQGRGATLSSHAHALAHTRTHAFSHALTHTHTRLLARTHTHTHLFSLPGTRRRRRCRNTLLSPCGWSTGGCCCIMLSCCCCCCCCHIVPGFWSEWAGGLIIIVPLVVCCQFRHGIQLGGMFSTWFEQIFSDKKRKILKKFEITRKKVRRCESHKLLVNSWFVRKSESPKVWREFFSSDSDTFVRN